MDKLKLYNADYRDIIPTLLDNSVDLFLIDIPYNISRKNNISTMKDRKNRVGLDYGEWDKDFNEKELNILQNKLKKGGSLLVWSALEQYDTLRYTFNELQIKDKLIWNKTNPMPRNRDRRYISNIELCSWFIKPGAKWTFNRQASPYETCILTYPVESGGGYKRFHPTQKNIDMIKNQIRIHTNPNDLVVDCFMGGGTTGVACKELERSFIGIELDEKYYNIAKQRIYGSK